MFILWPFEEFFDLHACRTPFFPVAINDNNLGDRRFLEIIFKLLNDKFARLENSRKILTLPTEAHLSVPENELDLLNGDRLAPNIGNAKDRNDWLV